MAITGDEKDWEQNDPVGVTTNSAERHEPEAREPSETDSSPDEADYEKQHRDPKKQESKGRPAVVRTQTAHTEASTASKVTTGPEAKKKLPLSKRLNPLKRNPRPVPGERQVSREYHANFFSKLSFQWISPLMAVRLPFSSSRRRNSDVLTSNRRSATPGHSKSTTCISSIPTGVPMSFLRN